jgi:hypothetical protein
MATHAELAGGKTTNGIICMVNYRNPETITVA